MSKITLVAEKGKGTSLIIDDREIASWNYIELTDLQMSIVRNILRKTFKEGMRERSKEIKQILGC